MKRTRRFLAAGIAAVLLFMTLSANSGCEDKNADEGNRDYAPADVTNFPRGFANIAHKCDGPNMIYSAGGSDAGVSIAVAPNDPRCDNNVEP